MKDLSALRRRRHVENHLPGNERHRHVRADHELRIGHHRFGIEILAITLDEFSAKIRTGGPIDDAADIDLPIWAGVLPLRLEVDEPEPASGLPDGIDVPGYLSRYGRTGPTA